MNNKVILFGGTFDPPHYGHIRLLEAAVKAVKPDEVIVMPTGTPPHKDGGHTDAALRMEMCGCFIPLADNVVISNAEIKRGGKSYTVDTLERMKNDMPSAHIFLPMGSDMLLSFKAWRNWQRILQLAVIIVHCRNEEDAVPVREYVKSLEAEGGDVIIVYGEIKVISSTEIRDRRKNGRDISDLVPQSVEKIITDNNLYME